MLRNSKSETEWILKTFFNDKSAFVRISASGLWSWNGCQKSLILFSLVKSEENRPKLMWEYSERERHICGDKPHIQREKVQEKDRAEKENWCKNTMREREVKIK